MDGRRGLARRAVEGDASADGGSLAGSRPHLEHAADGGQTVAHVHEPVSLGSRRRGEPGAVVADREAHLVADTLDGHPGGGLLAAVLGRVLEGLEAAEVHRGLDLLAEAPEVGVHLDRGGDRGPPGGGGQGVGKPMRRGG